jgi:two-component system, LytTR family, sensor kinase
MKLYLKIIIHAIYWLVYGSFSLAFSMAQQGNGWPLLSDITPHYFINFVWAVVAFYLFYFYFIRFFERKQFFLYLIFSVLLSIAITFAFLPIHKIFYRSFNLLDYRIFGPPMSGTFIILQCGILVRGFENWFSNIQLKAELENKNLKNELELLKAQVNPHFLFNTLNNIDSLITKEPAKASKALITLSDIMRYMLYETTGPEVDLSREISHIRNVISLQSLRFRQPDYVSFILNGSPENHQIAPLIFIPFIENAFKYAHYSGELPVVTIRFDITERGILFACINFFDPKKAEVLSSNRGLGLSNLRKQLSLLYPGRHELKVEKKNTKFEAVLQIDINHG